MKKSIFTFAFILVFAVTASAEGNTPVGGRTCPTGQTCLVSEQTETDKSEIRIIGLIKKLLAKIF